MYTSYGCYDDDDCEIYRDKGSMYDKEHIFELDKNMYEQKEKLLKNLSVLQNLYKACRVRKRIGGLPANELEQVNATLSEYDQRMLLHVTTQQDENKKDEGLDFLYDYEKTLADPSKITTETDRFTKSQENNMNAADTKIHYAVLHSELTGELSKELEESEKLKYSEEVDKLTRTVDAMEKDVDNTKREHESRMESAKYASIVEKLQKITYKMMNSDDSSDKNVKKFYKTLKELARERNELLQIIQHREKENKKLQDELRAAQDPAAKMEEQPLTPAELKEFQDRKEVSIAILIAYYFTL